MICIDQSLSLQFSIYPSPGLFETYDRSGAPTCGDLKTQGRCGSVTANGEEGAWSRRPNGACTQGYEHEGGIALRNRD
jgi:hypothetical protein